MNNKIEKLSFEELIKALDCCAHTIENNMCGECPASKYEAGKCDGFVKLQAAEMLKSQDEQIDNYIKTLAKNTNLIVKLNARLRKTRALNKQLKSKFKPKKYELWNGQCACPNCKALFGSNEERKKVDFV